MPVTLLSLRLEDSQQSNQRPVNMSGNDIGLWFRSIPDMTRYWFSGTIILSLAGRFGIVSYMTMILRYEFISRFQVSNLFMWVYLISTASPVINALIWCILAVFWIQQNNCLLLFYWQFSFFITRKNIREKHHWLNKWVDRFFKSDDTCIHSLLATCRV